MANLGESLLERVRQRRLEALRERGRGEPVHDRGGLRAERRGAGCRGDRLLSRSADRLGQVAALGHSCGQLPGVAGVRRRELRIDRDFLREASEQVGDRRLDEELLPAEPLAAPPQDPLDLEARDPDAEVAALVGDDLRQLLGPAAHGEEPRIEPALGEVAPEVALGVEHVHGRERHGIRDAADRVSLDDAAADAAEEEPLRVDRPLQLLGDRGDRLALQLVRLEAGERGEPAGGDRVELRLVGRRRGARLGEWGARLRLLWTWRLRGAVRLRAMSLLGS